MKNKWLTLFGLGHLTPSMAGTTATIASAFIFFVLKYILGWYSYTLLFMIFLPITMKLCDDVYSKDGDANYIVLDEAMGVAIFFIFAGPISVIKTFIGMLIFRILDIFKPWPISIWDNQGSGIGVISDDLIAGILAALIVSLF